MSDNYSMFVASNRASDPADNNNLRYSMKKAEDANSKIANPTTMLLNKLVSVGKIREIDRAFAIFVGEQLEARTANETLTERDHLLLVALAALTSEQLSRQHVCLEVSQLGGNEDDFRQKKFRQPWRPYFIFPKPEYCKQLLSSEVFNALGLLIFDGERLYLQRYWQYEQQVVKRLMHFSAPGFPQVDIRRCIDELYSCQPVQPGEVDWQKNAIALACLSSISVIAGGPGTGKTTTVVRILWCLCKLYSRLGKSEAIIKMVAPTGKAAVRLSESVSGAVEKLPGDVSCIPKDCSTIHRLLGVLPNSVFFKHSLHQPLNIDVLVVDEASMIDLPLLAKLFSALPSNCRVILLGDSHQLASVEVGSVFSDICQLQQGRNGFSTKLCETLEAITDQQLREGKEDCCVADRREGDFADNIMFLTKSWRFDTDSGIGHLAKAVNSGDVNKTLAVLRAGNSDLQWHTVVSEQSLLDMTLPHFISLHEAALNCKTPADVIKAFELLGELQLLTVKRSGKWGLQHINGLIKQALVKLNLIDANQDFYPGRPIMVSSNDYQNRLFNGDVGLVIRDQTLLQQTGRTLYKVYFRDVLQGVRTLLPAQLPQHDTMFAMTTHKSQGSEFSKVIFCLPESGNTGGNELLNRELLYTGITRAKSRFTLLADTASVSGAVRRVCQRASGLASVLAQNEL